MADIPGDATTRATLTVDRGLRGLHEAAGGDADWYKVRLEAGANYAFRARVFDAPGQPQAAGVLTLRDARGRVLARAYSDDEDGLVGGFDYRAAAAGTYFLVVESPARGGHEVAFEADEPGDGTTAATVRPGEPVRGDLFSGGDADTFAIRLERGLAYDLGLTRGDGEMTVAVLDDRGRVLVESGDLDEPRSSSFGGRAVAGLVEDFRATYTGTFHVRVATAGQGPGAYTLAVEEDRAAGPHDPAARPSAEDDLLLGDLVLGDRIDALGGDDVVHGRGGGDDLQGGDGADTLLGGDGRDLVQGGAGDDRLFGEGGDDRLAGGAGRDTLAGGTGRDVFVMDGAGFDLIADFEGGRDVIDLGLIDARPRVAGDQAFVFVGARPSTAAGQLCLERAGEGPGARVVLHGHTDADGTPDFLIFLGGDAAGPAAGDLVL